MLNAEIEPAHMAFRVDDATTYVKCLIASLQTPSRARSHGEVV